MSAGAGVTGALLSASPARAAPAFDAPRRRESAVVFLVSLTLYLSAAVVVVHHLHYVNGDAYARVANAWYVLFSRDPHLAAIGLVWPPLPSMLDLPLVALSRWLPPLVTEGFAGSVEAAVFSAGTVVVLNSALRRSDVPARARWAIVVTWAVNPMVVLYAVQGMSEAMYIFFIVSSFVLFLRWCETGAPVQLGAAGAMIGLGTLVRNEVIVVALALGIGAAIRSWRRGAPVRQVETELLLYGLPVVLCVAIFVGSNWVIQGDPLYFAHSAYGNSGQASVTGHFQVRGTGDWMLTTGLTMHSVAALFPAVVVVLGLLMLRIAVGRDRISSLILLMLAAPVVGLDIVLLHDGQFAYFLRYFIYVIPYTYVVVTHLVGNMGRLRGRLLPWSFAALVLLLAASDVVTARTMADPELAAEETDVVSAVALNGGYRSRIDLDRPVAARVAQLDKDHSLIALDTFIGYPIVLNVPDPSIFVITSDEEFVDAVRHPQWHHVDYFLVPSPKGGVSSLDLENRLYPSLWDNGGGFATLVADLGGSHHWRLYRIVDEPHPVEAGRP
jgi:hypothetical protein